MLKKILIIGKEVPILKYTKGNYLLPKEKKVKNYLMIIFFVIGLMGMPFAGNSRADIINGDFSSGLDGWTTADNILTIPSASVSVINEQAFLKTQGYNSEVTLISLFQTFTFPDYAYSLSFDIGFFLNGQDTGSDNGGNGHGFYDTVFVSYMDQLDSAYNRSFLAMDSIGPFDPNTLVPLTLPHLGDGMYRFTVVLGSGFQNRTGTLYFDLYDDDDFSYSLVKVDNVQISGPPTQIPEPLSLFLLGWGLLHLFLWVIFQKRRMTFI